LTCVVVLKTLWHYRASVWCSLCCMWQLLIQLAAWLSCRVWLYVLLCLILLYDK